MRVTPISGNPAPGREGGRTFDRKAALFGLPVELLFLLAQYLEG
ncbi:hypothetical protein [Methylobacterium sp. R2-1]|nr:hypothetical protein [Methylobacterium sp. R2-1]MBB2964872.1 hypothetical protein [Methylobacterium sp. R2-1]